MRSTNADLLKDITFLLVFEAVCRSHRLGGRGWGGWGLQRSVFILELQSAALWTQVRSTNADLLKNITFLLVFEAVRWSHRLGDGGMGGWGGWGLQTVS